MRIRRLDGFKDDYKRLLPEEQALVDKALGFLLVDPKYPSLYVKKRKGAKGIWEARASLNMRFTFTWENDLITLRAVGHHDEV
jgi:mRNA-degrading endonuclease RelE of RelBE toxin-antitoxin system